MTARPAAAASPLVPPPGIWESIGGGAPDADTPGLLRAARGSRNLLLVRALHQRARTDPAWRAIIAVLADVRAHAPAVFARFVADPATGAWLAHGVRAHRHDPAGAAPLAASVGHLARRPFALSVPVRHATVVLPGVGTATLPARARTAVIERDTAGTRISAGGTVQGVPDDPNAHTPTWQPTPHLRLDAGGSVLTVRLDRVDPLRLGAPPRAPRPPGPRERAAWHTRLDAAWRLLSARHPEQASTVREMITTVVPLHGEPIPPGTGGPWLSASFGDAVGQVALAPLDDPAELAAALVHETWHSMLYALLDLTPLLDTPPGERAYAPWSGDARPPSALLQGAVAFHATARFWHREVVLGNPRAHAPFARRRLTAHTALTALTSRSWPTEDGRRLLDAMTRTMASWADTPVDPDSAASATTAAIEHRVRWRLRHCRADPRVVDRLVDALHAGADVPTPTPGAYPVTPDVVELPHTRGGFVPDVRADTGPDGWADLALRVVRAADDGARALVAVPELVYAVHARMEALGAATPTPLTLARKLYAWADPDERGPAAHPARSTHPDRPRPTAAPGTLPSARDGRPEGAHHGTPT